MAVHKEGSARLEPKQMSEMPEQRKELNRVVRRQLDCWIDNPE